MSDNVLISESCAGNYCVRRCCAVMCVNDVNYVSIFKCNVIIDT